MTARQPAMHTSQSAANYISKKGINELFEAIMTALMIEKPDDHVAFIRECLDKAQQNPNRIRWELFVSNSNSSKSVLPSKPSVARNRSRVLPPVRNSTTTTKPNPSTSIKPPALPPIEDHKKSADDVPIIFVLSSIGATKLCSRLLERYEGLQYLSINDAANIDDDSRTDLKKMEHRYACVQRAIEERRSQTRGFLIVGEIEEKIFSKKWQDKLGRIDLIILLSSDKQPMTTQSFRIVQIDASNHFEDILADSIRALDTIFPQDAFTSDRSHPIETKTKHFSLPIIFCIDNHRAASKDENHDVTKPAESSSMDDEFDLMDDEHDEENSNSFINTLCERLAQQFTLKHIHYAQHNELPADFNQLKLSIIESMSSCSGYIIDHFPTSFDELEKFRTEIGPCTALIYIGEHRAESKDDDVNGIVEHFKKENKAIFVDSRMEVDEIYEDLKKDLQNHIHL